MLPLSLLSMSLNRTYREMKDSIKNEMLLNDYTPDQTIQYIRGYGAKNIFNNKENFYLIAFTLANWAGSQLFASVYLRVYAIVMKFYNFLQLNLLAGVPCFTLDESLFDVFWLRNADVCINIASPPECIQLSLITWVLYFFLQRNRQILRHRNIMPTRDREKERWRE
uniref:Uncharacterized protein n=1 Tax=Glossina brevipalpis TaxID=37001 RepID=A0A1A9W8A2_9MUSC